MIGLIHSNLRGAFKEHSLMRKRSILFFTALAAVLCLVSSSSHARFHPMRDVALRILGIIVKPVNPVRAPSTSRTKMIGGVSIISRDSDIVEEVLRFTEETSQSSGETIESEVFNKLKEHIDSRKKFSVMELLRPRNSEPPIENGQPELDEKEIILGLISRNKGRNFLYLPPEKFVRAYSSAKNNSKCKIDGGVCINFGVKPEASFQAQCGDGSITISTSGALSIKFDGISSSISINLEAN